MFWVSVLRPIVRDALIAAGASASAACHLAALQLLHRRDTQTLLKAEGQASVVKYVPHLTTTIYYSVDPR